MRESCQNLIEAHVSTLVFDTTGNTVLLLKRSKHRQLYKGLWESTGGQVLHGETFLQAAKRIAQDEIGVEILVKNILGTYFIPAKDDSARNRTIPGVRFYGIINKINMDRIFIGEQHSSFSFVDKKDLDSYALIPTLDEDIKFGFRMFNNIHHETLLR
ncbi:MAG: NUDIX hydrolase [Desulfuromonadales bacterium]|nr:NUDIX hydrolase [Desulfuromonadales bacterium]